MENSWLQSAVDWLDRTAEFLRKPLFWGIVLAAIVVGYLYRKLRPVAKPPSSSPRPAYLIKESARVVASALEVRQHDPVLAFQQAVQAQTMAQIAKDATSNMDELTTALGVNMMDYMTYVSDVVTDTRSRLRARR